MTPSPLDLAEVAYKAYGDRADWTNHAGNAMPSWEALPAAQRNAWVAAVGAVERALLRPPTASHGGPRSAYEASHPVMAHRSGATAAAAPVCKCPTGCGCGSNTGGRA